jgi:7-carboxy-7-deazaguanine synthase
MLETLDITVQQDVQTLPVMETFYSVQGEGFHTGKAAFFIRLGGCDVGCVWCDVKESWNAEKHPKRKVHDLAEEAAKSGAEIVVVTGGEPAMYDLQLLTTELRARGLQTHIETSGAHPLTGNWHWICFSPKKFKQPLPEICQRADELKVVVYNKHDLQWAQDHAANVSNNCKLFLQPEWGKREQVTGMIADFVRENTRWRISLQTHKYLNLP